MSITVIGDVHGKYDRYHQIIQQTEHHPYTLQIGDFGFKYDTLSNVDSTRHLILPGNHDNYDICYNYPHFLGDYGYTSLNKIEFFYYRGAYSIDKQYRTIGVDWWANEQVDIEGFIKAREFYRSTKPDIVITHDCPQFLISNYISENARIYENNTNWALEEFYNIHQPKLWIHGHYHVSKFTVYGKTTFLCLSELETYQLTKESLMV